jgi:hypothetical protein
VGLKIQA